MTGVGVERTRDAELRQLGRWLLPFAWICAVLAFAPWFFGIGGPAHRAIQVVFPLLALGSALTVVWVGRRAGSRWLIAIGIVHAIALVVGTAALVIVIAFAAQFE